MRRIAYLVVALAALAALAPAAHASHRFDPHRHRTIVEGVGTQTDPVFVYDSPSSNPSGGSHAWADYGLYQTLRATRPSPAAHALCDLTIPGDSIWVSGGMLLPGEWALEQAPPPWQQTGDMVTISVTDPDGTHGGMCSPLGMVLEHVG